MGLDPGWALDLTVTDEDGLAWDFSTQAKRAKAPKKVREDKPFMLITSPMCGPFSALQSFLKLSEYEDCRSQTEVE